MKTPFARRDFLKAAGAAAATLAAPSIGFAQAYPAKTIKLIVPWSAGGPTDLVMRAMAEAASKTLGQRIIVDNKGGAGGTLGAAELVNAAPDGYTISQIPISVMRFPHMQKTQFDPLKDITYIACLTGYTFGFVVRSDSQFKSMADVVAYAKANPGKFSYSSTGTGTTPHLVMEEFSQKAGIEMLHIPFKGNADAMQAILGGHIMGVSDSTGWAGAVDAGRCRLLATYGSKRTKRWASTPTLKDLGYDTVSDSPFGIGGPKGMDPAVINKLQEAFKKTLEDPSVIQLLERFDQPVIYMDNAAYTKFAHDTFYAEKRTMERLGLARAA